MSRRFSDFPFADHRSGALKKNRIGVYTYSVSSVLSMHGFKPALRGLFFS
jgi:hypothetical protein